MKKNKKIFFTYLISYIIIGIFPLSISLIGYHICEKMIEEEILVTQENSLLQFRNSFDNAIENIILDGKTIGGSDTLQSLANEVSFTTDDRMKIRDLRNELALQKSRTGLSSEMIIFFYENSTILTDEKVYDKSVNHLYFSNGKNTEESLDKALQLNGIRGYTIGENQNGGQNLLFVENIYNYNFKEKVASVILTIPWSNIQKQFSDIKGGQLYWVNKSDHVLSLNSEISETLFLPYDTFQNEGELIYSAYGNQTVISSFCNSQFSDWKYCITMPKSYYFQKLEQLHFFIVAEMVVLVLLAMLMALFYAYHNYKPIARIIAQIRKNQKDHSKNIAFAEIEEYLDQLHKENQKLNTSWKKARDSAAREILACYLKGWNSDSTLLCETIQAISAVNLLESYAVFLITLNDIDQCKLFEDETNPCDLETQELLQFIFYNIFNEVIFSRYKGFITNIDNMYFCILQLPSQTSLESAAESMKECAQIYLDRMNLSIFVAVSCLHRGIEELQKAYNETVQIISYQSFWGTANELVVIYESTYNIQTAFGEEIRVAEEQKKLYNLMLSQKYDDAKHLFTQITDHLFIKDISCTEVNQCRIFGMVNIICMFLVDILGKKDEEFMYRLHPMERLSKTRSAIEAKQGLQEIFDEIINHLKTCLTEDRPIWIGHIIHIVEKEYGDVNLNVSALAGRLNMNLAYIGRTFKQYMGVSLPDYIHSVRIRECKKLLSDGISVAAAAEAVGYVDAKSLIRIFKKLEGITPGQYKSNTEKYTYKNENI